MKKDPTPDTGNDETPPHGITRPSPDDLARAYLVRSEMLTDDPADRDALATLAVVLESLDLIVRCWLSGDGGTIDQVVEASGHLFGWRTCPVCHDLAEPDEWDARGFCADCYASGDVECSRCGETGRLLDEESTCADCLGLYPEEMGEDDPEVLYCSDCGNVTHDDTSTVFETVGTWELTRVCFQCAPPDEDDQDRDPYGAPYGGRDDLDVPALRDALVRWHDDDEPLRVRFGIIPDGYHGDTADLVGDLSVFYWLTRTEAACLLPGGDDQHDEWVVVDCETPEPCRHGHHECAVIAGGLCWNGARHDLDDLGNPFGGALDR